MEHSPKILSGSSEEEKSAYLAVIASLATADRQASPEEITYLDALCDSADLSPQDKENVLQAANETTGNELTAHLNVLKNSELKYSLVADLINFAKADSNYSAEEQQSIEQIARYLQVNKEQLSLLKEFTDKAEEANAAPEQINNPAFLASTGLQDRMQKSGIHTGGLLKGLISIAGPLILSRMMGRSFGGSLGRSLNPLGRRSGMGGMGSLISMLSGGRGMRGAGGMLGRILKGL